MKETIKEIVKCCCVSIAISLAIFCTVGVLFDLRFGGQFSLENYQFTKMVLGCVLIGLGFGVPSIVYQNENLPMPIKVLIQMGIGCAVYTLVACSVGWIETTGNFVQTLMIVLIQLGLAFVIWICFMLFYRKEAQQLNAKIQNIKGQNSQK